MLLFNISSFSIDNDWCWGFFNGPLSKTLKALKSLFSSVLHPDQYKDSND